MEAVIERKVTQQKFVYFNKYKIHRQEYVYLHVNCVVLLTIRNK